MLNRIVLIGRLTKDPELRSTSSGVPVATFTLAVDRGFKNAAGEKETDFVPIVVWRGQAETCATYLSKGKLAAVDGRLQIRSYDDREGTRRTVAEVVAEHVRFLSPKECNDFSQSSDTDLPNFSEESPAPDDVPF